MNSALMRLPIFSPFLHPELCPFVIIKPEMMKDHNDGTPNRRNEESMVT